MCTEMPNLKANFLTSLTKEVNPERLVAKAKAIATNWNTLPKSKTLSKNEPKEPKERKVQGPSQISPNSRGSLPREEKILKTPPG